MERILIAGTETVVGANFAATFSESARVAGLSFNRPVAIAGCDGGVCASGELDAIRSWLAQTRPERVVYCGAAAETSWTGSAPDVKSAAKHARHWAMAAAEAGCLLTYISSDAVFTGPWMFHAETCNSFCLSAEATTLRSIEDEIARLCPNALILRVNAFGWKPRAAGAGFIENLVSALEDDRTPQVDCVRHASPIHAADLAEITSRAWQAGLDGLYHVGGAERVNPVQFAERLAAEFSLSMPRCSTVESLTNRAVGYGAGETSLQTRKLRRALGIALPMLSEGLRRLYEQSFNGDRDRLNATPLVCEKVA